MTTFYNPNARTGYTKCRYCGAPITFDPDVIGRNGRPVPLDPNVRSPHRCFNTKAFDVSTSSSSFNLKAEEDQSKHNDSLSPNNTSEARLTLENLEKLNRLKDDGNRIILTLDQVIMTNEENRQLLEKILKKISADLNTNSNNEG
jgi:hypothetical protein